MTKYIHFIYKARDGWRWHIKTRNGKIVAESGEAYSRKAGVRRAWNSFARSFGMMTVT